MPLEKKA